MPRRQIQVDFSILTMFGHLLCNAHSFSIRLVWTTGFESKFYAGLLYLFSVSEVSALSVAPRRKVNVSGYPLNVWFKNIDVISSVYKIVGQSNNGNSRYPDRKSFRCKPTSSKSSIGFETIKAFSCIFRILLRAFKACCYAIFLLLFLHVKTMISHSTKQASNSIVVSTL